MARQRARGVLLGVSAALHAYVGWRLLAGTGASPLVTTLATAGLAVSALLVPQGLRLETGIPRRWARRLELAGLSLMGLLSSLWVLTLIRDVLIGGGWLAGYTLSASQKGTTSILVIALAVAMTGWGWVQARRTAPVRWVTVPVPGLPVTLAGLTIAQISDIHVGPTIRRPYLEKIVKRVNELQADIVAVTGDWVDGSVAELQDHVQPFAELQGRLGTYFVNGNHEYYSGEPGWTAELRRIGCRVLKNEHVVLQRQQQDFVLAGVTDYSAHLFNPDDRSDPAQALAGAPDVPLRILLAHQPRSLAAAAAAGFDLQLSGHTHGGQFWPWGYFVPLQQPLVHGLHRIGRLLVYVSRGTGYWGPPMRFGAPSEITLLTLQPA